MVKSERTPEQIAAAKARMAKVRAARQNKNPETKTPEIPTEVYAEASVEQPVIEEKTDFAPEPSVQDLMLQIAELKALHWQAQAQGNAPQGVTAGGTGKLTGTYEKYAIDPANYPDPTARIAVHPKLQRFAFDLNYELIYTLGTSEYTTIDNVRTREPKFSLELVRVVMDEETGEPTNGRYVICRLVMHEDPETALIIAREQGLPVNENGELEFLNEMRFIRMRDWVLECFYPAPVKAESNKREMVINGKLVTYYEKNNENGTGVTQLDWDKLPKIKF
jgi:hypothetical protein